MERRKNPEVVGGNEKNSEAWQLKKTQCHTSRNQGEGPRPTIY